MLNLELRDFFATHLRKIDYSLRDLRQSYVLAADADEMLEKRMQAAQEAIADARETLQSR